MESRNWFYVSRESLAAAELADRVNCWRQNVEPVACNTLVTNPTNNNNNPSTFQYPFPCEGLVLPPSLQTRPRNSTRRRKPYTRPPDSPRHQRAPPQMMMMDDVSDLPIDHDAQPGFLDTRQVCNWGMAERDDCGLSGLTTSIKESAGLDLPHPEKNPLIAYQPDVLKEEYCRLAFLFNKLNVDRRKEECRYLQMPSNDAMKSIMELGSNIRRVANAAEYVIEYSQCHGWDIDFAALACGVGVGGAQPPPMARVVPSRVRELVCSTNISNNRESSGDWHLYPAA